MTGSCVILGLGSRLSETFTCLWLGSRIRSVQVFASAWWWSVPKKRIMSTINNLREKCERAQAKRAWKQTRGKWANFTCVDFPRLNEKVKHAAKHIKAAASSTLCNRFLLSCPCVENNTHMAGNPRWIQIVLFLLLQTAARHLLHLQGWYSSPPTTPHPPTHPSAVSSLGPWEILSQKSRTSRTRYRPTNGGNWRRKLPRRQTAANYVGGESENWSNTKMQKGALLIHDTR